MNIDRKTQQRLRKLQFIRSNFEYFCNTCLKIVHKQTREEKFFQWNRAQQYVDLKIEEQRKLTGGIVRVLILKGRQQGISTYVAARFYHKASLFRRVTVYILSHMQTSATNLFSIVEDYQVNNPFKPHVGTQNKTEMEFDRMKSSYSVATAGEGEGGRSQSSTLFHGSEVAFWRNADKHFKASVQTVPYAEGTEVILETTANGPTGKFYELWQEAEAGRGDYIAIFVPWYWQDEYARPVPDGFDLADDGDDDNLSEIEYFEAFGGHSDKEGTITLPHMMWRRNKISEMGGVDDFNQEYPGTPQMAFMSSNKNSYISGKIVLAASKRTVSGAGPLLFGVDPSGQGGDRFAICGRRGNAMEVLEWKDKLNTLEAYYYVKKMYLEHSPAKMFIDAGGLGAAIIDLLRADGDIPNSAIVSVNFGSTSQFKMLHKSGGKNFADAPPGPINRRAEMYMRMRNWLASEEGVSIFDMDELRSDLTATQVKPTYNQDLQLESKDDMRSRGVRSPDLADGLALTFASLSRISEYVEKGKKVNPSEPDRVGRRNTGSSRSTHGWMS